MFGLTPTSPVTSVGAVGNMCAPRGCAAGVQRGSHHLWYLQVSAPLTSSLMEPASLRSSSRITSGTSAVPVSRSIWLARLDRYSCRSWNKQAGCHMMATVTMAPVPTGTLTLQDCWCMLKVLTMPSVTSRPERSTRYSARRLVR